MNDFLIYMENSILTTANLTQIKQNLGVTDDEALIIHRLAQAHQVDLNMKEVVNGKAAYFQTNLAKLINITSASARTNRMLENDDRYNAKATLEHINPRLQTRTLHETKSIMHNG